jgi:hypothetical protein
VNFGFLTGPEAAKVENSAPYDVLGILGTGTRSMPTSQCLWMQEVDGFLRAALSETDIQDCVTAVAPPALDPVWNRLRVVRQQRTGSAATDYPPTARWQWTTDGDSIAQGEHYMGVPGPWGVIRPQPGHSVGPFQRKARYRVTPGRGHGITFYVGRLNLNPAGISFIYLNDSGVPITGVYWSTTGAQNAVVTEGSFKHGALGAVRWRWRENDESGWISCGVGCCDVELL